MMNDFENGNINESADRPSGNEPNITFSSTYTPEGNGYTKHTSENSGENYQFSGNYNRNYPQSNKSKAPFIILMVCGILFSAVLFTCIGFTIGKTSDIFSNTSDVVKQELITPGTDEDTYPDSTAESESPETEQTDENDSELGATITKTEGGSIKTDGGVVGELMTKAQAAALVKDSVVEITTEQVVNGNSFYQYVQSGAGSGVIVSDSGYVITNNHVVEGSSKITVRLTNGNEYTAKLIGTDASSDIAIIKIEPNEELTVAVLGSSAKLSIAEEILVIGNPLGKLGGTVTNGIVSALAREITIDGENMTLIQTNAAVNPGNSGGGMFNLYGELVGIVNAKSSGEDVEGLGFAIPIDTAYDIMLQLTNYGYVKGRIDHGLNLIDITDLFTAASYRVSSLGVYVYESKYTDEIKNGDRIASINGKEVSSAAEVKEALSGCHVGDAIEVTVVRKGKFVNVELTLHEYVPEDIEEVNFE